MAEIRVPRLGWSMESGVFVRWLKQDGDEVKLGDALYELEGEKASQEIEAVDAGVLRIPADAPAPGSDVLVGALLGYVMGAGESMPADAPTASATEQTKAVPAPATTVKTSGGNSATRTAGPAARRRAREISQQPSIQAEITMPRSDSKNLPRRAGNGEIRPGTTAAIASPRARRVAKEVGVDWRTLQGSGRNGRIREQDVLQCRQQGSAASAIPLTQRRRTIAQRMLQSSQQTAPVTLTTRADATNLASLRRQFKSTGGIVPTYTDVVAKLVASVLQQHPLLAGRLEDTQIAVPGPEDINIGIAVDTDSGLLVPVMRNVAGLSLLQVAKQSAELVESARRGALKAADMQGGVFTITNLGNFGIDAFTPIINVPETAILGLGAIRREAVVTDGDQIVARDQMVLSLTFDHRVVDGAPAAQFLKTVVAAVENPSAWLIG